MQSYEQPRGSRNRIMILTYITWLTLSLAPAMMTPPERRFSRGQPEMQQAMDNMVTHKTIITKRTAAASNDLTVYQEMLTSKTSDLLEEAEKLMKDFPNSKEKQWIESFVQRLRGLSSMLEKAPQKKNLPENPTTVNGTPVPEGLPLQPTWPATTSAVPGNNPFQKTNRMVSKFPVTSPELSKVLPANEYPSERQAVTKPAVLPNNKDAEDDELVRELESLPKEYEYLHQHHEENPKEEVEQVIIVTTPPPPPVFVEGRSSDETNVEEERTKLQTRLIQEIEEFQRLGGVPNEVIHALHTDNHKTAGFAHKQIANIEDKMKFTEAGMVDRQGIQRFSDINNEDKEISNTNLWNSISEKNIPYQEGYQIQQMKSNHSFQNIHPNYYPNQQAYPKQFGNYFYYMSPQNKVPYQGGQPNRMLNYQKINPYNQGKYHAMHSPTNQQPGHIPDALKQMLSKPQNNFYIGHLPSDYNEYLIRHSYGPYPYQYNSDPKNSTVYLAPRMSPNLTKPPMNLGINTHLSDEMERQLRDGKIIVLSNNLVRSNFEPTNGKKSVENTTEKPKNEKSEKSVATEK